MEQEKKQAVALMRYSAIAPLITGTQEDYESLTSTRKRSFAWITLPGPKASAFLPVLRAGRKQLWFVPGLPD